MNKFLYYLTENDCYKAGRRITPSGIVVHSTGVNQRKISAYVSQFNQPGVNKCVHGFIGIDAKNQLAFAHTLPFGFRCWGCGSGSKGSYNNTHIQFEICEDKTSKQYTDQTYQLALDLCEELCLKYNIPADKVVSHSEAYKLGYASNHADCDHWWRLFGYSMNGFRAELKERLEVDMQTRFKTIAEVPASLKKETQELINSGALKGNENGLDVTEDMLRTMIICKRYVDGR